MLNVSFTEGSGSNGAELSLRSPPEPCAQLCETPFEDTFASSCFGGNFLLDLMNVCTILLSPFTHSSWELFGMAFVLAVVVALYRDNCE